MFSSVLALDAACEACSVALQIGSKRYFRESCEPRKHAQQLLPMVHAVLQEADVRLSELSHIAVINGPGSFTGLRIAVSVVQGLAFAANLPVVALSSLEVMAHQALLNQPSSVLPCLSVLDARMHEVYWAVYKNNEANGYLDVVSHPQVSGDEDFRQQLASLMQQNPSMMAVGNGLELAMVDSGVFCEQQTSLIPHACALLDALSAMPQEHVTSCKAHELEPLYVRNDVAWQKRERLRQSPISLI